MRPKDSSRMSKHRNVLQEQSPRKKIPNDRQHKPRKSIVSLFMSRLRKSKRISRSEIAMTMPELTTASTTASEETPPSSQREVQSSYFEPNWEYLAPPTAVDLDDDSNSTPEQPDLNKVGPSTSWWMEGSYHSPHLNSKDGVCPEKLDTTSSQYEDALLQVPLSRRILVDLAQVVDSLEAPPSEREDIKPRARGDASLGDSQPRQPARSHHEENKNAQGLPTKIATHESENGISDDLSSCSGITIDSSLFHHSESIISSLFAQPQFGRRIPALRTLTS
mmetsp:Transcript_9761/g.18853  ORF Transcript_9761/g.18853 Transcript_9761/m.18853 type:complete len:278 (-) Transcript_9761:324-1157(-)